MYCASFVLTRAATAQAEYQAYSAMLNVLTEYRKLEKKIFVDNIKENINAQIKGNEDRLRQNVFLPPSSSDLKSLTSSNCSDLVVYAQKTDISNLCTFNVRKAIEIYNNYLSAQEVKNLEDTLLRAKEDTDKYSYITNSNEYSGYHTKREKANKVVLDNQELLSKIKDKTFFDCWYKGLLKAIFEEAQKNKKHILHGEILEHASPFIENKINGAKNKLATSFNKEIIRRVLSELLALSTVGKEVLEYMKCINIDDQKGKMNYETVNYRIIERANELIMEDSMDDTITAGLQYIVENMHASLLFLAEQKILNEIVEKTANREAKDMMLLAILNGGEFKEGLSLPTNLAFSEIERLYKDMLLLEIEDIEQSTSMIWENQKISGTLFEKLPLLALEEIREVFSSSITDEILDEMQKTLDTYIGELKEIRKKIVDRVFGKKENIEKLYDLEKELEFSFWQRLLHPFYYGQYLEERKFSECKEFIAYRMGSQKGISFRKELEEQVNRLERPKREALKRVLLSNIDEEFQQLADELIRYDHELKSKIGQSGKLQLFSPAYWDSYEAERASLKKCMEALQKSVAAGDDTLFYQTIEDIKKSSKRMWVFQVNKELFNGIYKTTHDPKEKMLSFQKLAEGLIARRKEYVAEQVQKYEIQKAIKEHHKTNIELAEKSMNDQMENHQLREENQVAKDEAEKERKARKEAEAKTAEAEVKAAEERAKAETLASLLLQIKSGALPLSALDSIELDSVVKSSQKR